MSSGVIKYIFFNFLTVHERGYRGLVSLKLNVKNHNMFISPGKYIHINNNYCHSHFEWNIPNLIYLQDPRVRWENKE